MKKLSTKIISIALFVTLSMNIFSGCTPKNHKESDLFQTIKKNDIIAPFNTDSNYKTSVTNFGIELLKAQYKDDNILLSPYSVFGSLLMVANGSEGITREQFEDVFHMTIEEANEYILYTTGKSTQSTSSINALWINDKNEIEFSEDYLQIMADYFESNVYYETFDKKTVDNINNFVKEHTDKLISKVIDKVDNSSPMILVNTQYFSGLWSNEFDENRTQENTFNNLDDSTSKVPFMNREVTNCYLQVKNGYGVSLPYQNGYFIALRPDANTDFDTFLEGLDGKSIINSLSKNPFVTYRTDLKLPKFNLDYETSLNDAIKNIGLESAFDDSADFSGMTKSKNDFYIDNVIHKTTIKVDEKGTVAAAATIVEMGGMAAEENNIKRNAVIFDRPFFYMITDRYGTPLFMGIITNFD